METMNLSHEALPANKAFFPPEEEIIGNTYYDLQSNSSMQNRIFVYDDGTIGAVYTLGFDYPNFAGDRGTDTIILMATPGVIMLPNALNLTGMAGLLMQPTVKTGRSMLLTMPVLF
ncbi:MAG: hypothetical protein R2764_10295 [Bacteroidales bacterium]